jgi:protoheme IX farnesyltransferase
MLKTYYYLTKPGIIYGNLLSTLAGFFLAAKGAIDLVLLVAVVSGTALVIGSGCVFNNYIDRDVDRRMTRTKKRALVTGSVSARNALSYAAILGALGFAILSLFTNALVVMAGFIGIFFYVVVYGFAKRRSPLGTIVGSIPGAMPLVAGYVAVTGRFDMGALLLFLIMAVWQMPHFYAIATFRLKEYATAGLPVLPVKKGIRTAKWHICFYIVLYLIVTSLLSLTGYTGYTYRIVMLLIGTIWLYKAVQGFKTTDDVKWGRSLFGFSLVVLLAFSIMISAEVVLP